MRKKGIPEALVRAVMILYKGAKTKVKAGAHQSDEGFEVNVGIHQEYTNFITIVVFHCD